MSMFTITNKGIPDQKLIQWFWTALLGVTLFRVVVLLFAAPELGPDETQYWFWAQDLDFGYFSKPPIIAWAIAATTSIFGDAAWSVRLPAPLFHAGSSFFLFLLTKEKLSPRAGLVVGLTWLTLPGVSLSSALIATDAPMLFFWAMSLYLLFNLVEGRRKSEARTAAFLGVAMGAGMLAKYAMIYFPIGILIAVLCFKPFRAKWKWLALSFGVGIAVFAPNIVWNLQNDFSTLSHTSANANWGSSLFNIQSIGNFLGGQFGVAGLFTFAVIAAMIGFVRSTDQKQRNEIAPLLCFVVPALSIITIQAFLSRAHANWAAAAYPAATIFAVAWLSYTKKERLLTGSIIVHSIALLVFSATIVSATFADQIGFSGAYKRLRGWTDHGASITALMTENDITTLMADDREILGGLAYYARGNHALVAWNSNNKIDDHYEAFHPFTEQNALPILYVTTNTGAIGVSGHFKTITHAGISTASLGGGRERTLFLFILSDFEAPKAP